MQPEVLLLSESAGAQKGEALQLSSVVVGPRTDALKDNEQKARLLVYELIPKLL